MEAAADEPRGRGNGEDYGKRIAASDGRLRILDFGFWILDFLPWIT